MNLSQFTRTNKIESFLFEIEKAFQFVVEKFHIITLEFLLLEVKIPKQSFCNTTFASAEYG